jgi:K+-transporting ATPase ATPase C chain
MARHLTKSLLLLGLVVVICCGVYPLAVWAIAQTFFPFQANGSMVTGPDGAVIGSLLIAQPLTRDEYFQPRPSAASYDASASTSSALAASNYALRDRVARTIGPIAKYASGAKAGQLVAPDVEAWFQQDRFQGQPQIVAQWADAHNGLAQAWAKSDPMNTGVIDEWTKAHP